MSVFLLKKPNALFIHIPKTGGSTVRWKGGVWDKNYEGPRFGAVPEEWQGNFSFAFVRHPIERFFSSYRDFKHNRGYEGTVEEFAEEAMRPIDDWVPVSGGVSPSNIRHHTAPMSRPRQCLHHAEYIGRFERFETDLRVILDIVGAEQPDELPHIRPSTNEQPRLDISLNARLCDFYALDFEKYGYSA